MAPRPFWNAVAPIAAAEPPITLAPLTGAEGIVCTGLVDDLTETPDDYRATLLYAKTQGLKLLCANPDIIVDYGDKRLFCAGAIAQEYDRMGGESLYFGKPHPPIYDLARRRMAKLADLPADPRIIAIGDGVHTDILGAMQEEIDSLFITGGLAAHETRTITQPEPGALARFLETAQTSATYSIGFLR